MIAIVAGIGGIGAEVVDLMTEGGQAGDDGLFVGNGGVVTGDGDAHGGGV